MIVPIAAAAGDPLELNRTEVTLYVGSVGSNPVASVNKSFLSALAGGPVESWTSSDPAVARVSPSGIVTAMTVGTAVITAESADDTATVTVTVVNLPDLEGAVRPAGYSATKPTDRSTTSGTSSMHDSEVVWDPVAGRYYGISTNNRTLYRSSNITTWTTTTNHFSSISVSTNQSHYNTYNYGQRGSGGTSWWAPCLFYNEVMERWCIYYSHSSTLNDGGRGFGPKTSSIGLAVLNPVAGQPYSLELAGSNWQYRDIVVRSYDALTNWSTGNANLVSPWLGFQLTTSANGAWRLGPNNPLSSKYGPNCIDAQIIQDVESGRIFMDYGSFWEGIFLLELDPATGLPFANVDSADPDYELKTAPGLNIANRGGTYITAEPLDARRTKGGNGPTNQRYHVGIEGPHIFHNENTGYYYLIVAYGYNNGSYNMRVGRSKSVTGPYYDYNGFDMVTSSPENLARTVDPIDPLTIYSVDSICNSASGWNAQPGLAAQGLDGFIKSSKLQADPRVSWDPNVGTKILMPYRWVNYTGTQAINTYTAVAHHNVFKSLRGDYMTGHIQKGSGTQMGMRNFLWTEDGWPMCSPAQYADENIHQPIDAVRLAASSNAITAYNFELMLMPRDLGPDEGGTNNWQVNSTNYAASVVLRPDGTVYCAGTGTIPAMYNNAKWRLREDNKMEITLPGTGVNGGTFVGVVAVGWDWENWDAGEFVFAGMNEKGTMLWGKGGNYANTNQLTTNKTALAAALDVNETLYPPAQWETAAEARAYAQVVNDDVSAVQQEIDEAAALLNAAIDKLDPLTFGLGAQTASVVLRKGMTYQINIESNSPTTVVYLSSNANASVDQFGKVTALKTGTAVITVLDVYAQRYFTVTINITS